MQEAYAARRVKLAEAERLYREMDSYILGRLGVSFADIQGKRVSIKPISEIKGGRFDFEAVVTMNELNLDLVHTMALHEVATQMNERVTPIETYPGEDINYIGLGHIASNVGELTDFVPIKGKDILSSSPIFKKGDILFGRMRPYLNKVWVAEFDGVCSGEAIVLRPDTRRVNIHFLHALLLSRITLNQVIPLQSGTSLPRVSASDVLNIKLPILQDVGVQKEIGAEILSRRTQARHLRTEAESIVAEAKARVERMILGEEPAE
jgi:hypothetical protein